MSTLTKGSAIASLADCPALLCIFACHVGCGGLAAGTPGDASSESDASAQHDAPFRDSTITPHDGAEGDNDSAEDGRSLPDGASCAGNWCTYYEPPFPPDTEKGLFSIAAVWGAGATDVWFVGDSIRHWDGKTLTDHSVTKDTLTGVWGTGSSDVWAVGSAPKSGAFYHWDGATWSRQAAFRSLGCVWANTPTDAWAAESGSELGTQILHWNGSAWGTASKGTAERMWGSGSSDIWAIGGGVLQWNGTAWSSVTLPPGDPFAVGGSAPNDLWIAGLNTILHWDGSTWSNANVSFSGYDIQSVWANSTTDAWAVGSSTFHWDGTIWSIVADGPAGEGLNPQEGLHGVWSSGPGDAWIVGKGSIFHYGG
jgi:hypothetical protein